MCVCVGGKICPLKRLAIPERCGYNARLLACLPFFASWFRSIYQLFLASVCLAVGLSVYKGIVWVGTHDLHRLGVLLLVSFYNFSLGSF